jgi:hypothetical protein
MKKFLLIACTALFATSCNNESKEEKAATASENMSNAPSEKMDYPYTIDRPYPNWQIGDQMHVVTVMKGLKGFVDNDIAASAATFGDTVELRFDNYFAKVSNDSLKKIITAMRADYTSIKIKMGDWISVISSDKKDEWVTMWYDQVSIDKKGKKDSMAVVDDAKLVNGKVVILDEKIQHYPVKK